VKPDADGFRGLHGEAGDTLVEILITITIMAVVFVTMLMALWTSNSVSDAAHRQSRVAVEANSLGQVFLGLPHAGANYYSCETAAQYVTDYKAATNTAVPGFPTSGATGSTLTGTNKDTVQLTVTYLANPDPEPAGSAVVASNFWVTTCTKDANLNDKGAQLITVTVTSSSKPGVSASVSVVRRNDVCIVNSLATSRPGYLPGQRC
jgi:hypothetical protein